MTVHVQRLSNKNLNLLVRIYSDVPDDAPAYHHRLDYDAICLATIKPDSKHLAWLHAYRGRMTKKDYIDLGERIYKESGATEIMYERAAGYVMHYVRKGKRKWKRVPVKRNDIHVLAVSFSGIGED